MVSSSTTTKYQVHKEFFLDQNLRKIFNNRISSTRKFYSKLNNIVFWDNCILSSTIPASFRIQSQPYPNTSSQSQTRWTLAAKSASIQWMKIKRTVFMLFINHLAETWHTQQGFPAKFLHLFFSRKRLNWIFVKKAKIFIFFASERNPKKSEISAKRFSLYAGNPIVTQHYIQPFTIFIK